MSSSDSGPAFMPLSLRCVSSSVPLAGVGVPLRHCIVRFNQHVLSDPVISASSFPRSPDPDTTYRLYGPPLQQQASQAPPATVTVTAVRMYNYAIPQMELAAEAGCVDAGSCGRFFLAGWTPKPYGSTGRAPGPGSVTTLNGAVSPGVGPDTTAQRYNTSGGGNGYSYYIDVGPWGPCSSSCGSGGRRVRDVQCLRIGLGGTQVLPADQCLVASLPATSEPCNTLACPSARLEVVAPPAASACSPGISACTAGTAGGAAATAGGGDGTRLLQVMCRSSIG